MSVYAVTEIIGTSSTSWEDAAAQAIRTAAGTLRDLRVAEVVEQDIHLDEDGRSPIAPSFSSPSSTSPTTDPRSAAPSADGLSAPASGANPAAMPERPLRTHRKHQEHVPGLRQKITRS